MAPLSPTKVPSGAGLAVAKGVEAAPPRPTAPPPLRAAVELLVLVLFGVLDTTLIAKLMCGSPRKHQ